MRWPTPSFAEIKLLSQATPESTDAIYTTPMKMSSQNIGWIRKSRAVCAAAMHFFGDISCQKISAIIW
jgi:hypothetical protein